MSEGYEVPTELPAVVSKIEPLVDELCKTTELASRYKIVRREPGRDGKILSDHRQDGNDEVHRL